MRGKTRIGVVGTGFIGRGLLNHLRCRNDFDVGAVLTRRPIDSMTNFPFADRLTNDVSTLLKNADVIVECSGDVVHATDVVRDALEADLPVVTMDAEFQITTASYFVDKGVLTESEGDQPGCLAALRDNIVQMGFKPLVYGNIKKFLNPDPQHDEMRFWATKQGISLPQVTAFTDGTKIQIEQALVANGLGAGIAVPGLLGLAADDVNQGATVLADGARRLGYPISDYILSPNAPAGVFIAAEHEDDQREYLRYLKLGDGPYYVLLQNFHLCHLEIAKTIRRVLETGSILLNNSLRPQVGVASLAKSDLPAGTRIERGIGSFSVRGKCVRLAENPEHVPIGLLSDAVLERPVEKGQMLTFEDVSLPDSFALHAWKRICDRLRTDEPADISASAR